MTYKRFYINQYKAVKDSSISLLNEPIPIIGVNESGKSSVLEAIAHFDYRNDSIADQKKWKFQNRYIPKENEYVVGAELDLTQDDIVQISENFSDGEKDQVLDLLKPGQLFIDRIFKKDSNSMSYRIGGQDGELIEHVVELALERLPRILYFDNLLENPFPNTIKFPQDYLDNPNYGLDEYQAVAELMFSDAGYDLKQFFNETDENTNDTIISAVNRYVTDKMLEDWKKMHVGNEELDTESIKNLKININRNRDDRFTLDINIKEVFMDKDNEDHETSMTLGERSLGFRWFFNFSAKKCFGARTDKKFVYLIDEPGSFLHNGAQKVLLSAIVELAKVHVLIYATHSEFLLDPELVNINNIKVIEKSDRLIKVIPFAQTKNKKNAGALSTLYHSLRMNVPFENILKKKIIVTEGITDFYFWMMLLKDIIILPGYGAGQSRYLISMAMGTTHRYLVFFDGDAKGNESIKKYETFFGAEQSANWKKYVDSSQKEICLEAILSDKDQNRLKDLMKILDLKKAVTSLYFSNQKDEFWGTIDATTKANLEENYKSIQTILGIELVSHLRY